jgi:hypothetical protein
MIEPSPVQGERYGVGWRVLKSTSNAFDVDVDKLQIRLAL